MPATSGAPVHRKMFRGPVAVAVVSALLAGMVSMAGAVPAVAADDTDVPSFTTDAGDDSSMVTSPGTPPTAGDQNLTGNSTEESATSEEEASPLGVGDHHYAGSTGMVSLTGDAGDVVFATGTAPFFRTQFEAAEPGEGHLQTVECSIDSGVTWATQSSSPQPMSWEEPVDPQVWIAANCPGAVTAGSQARIRMGEWAPGSWVRLWIKRPWRAAGWLSVHDTARLSVTWDGDTGTYTVNWDGKDRGGAQFNYCSNDGGATWTQVWSGWYPQGMWPQWAYTDLRATIAGECGAVPGSTRFKYYAGENLNPNDLVAEFSVDRPTGWVDTNLVNLTLAEQNGNPQPGAACGDPVNTGTGEFYEPNTDLVLPGRAPVVWSRTYSSTTASQDGLLGFGWNTPAGTRLDLTTSGKVGVVSEAGTTIPFTDEGDGTYSAAPHIFSTLTRDAGSGVWEFTSRDRTVWTFTSAGLLTSVSDRNGETVTYTRDSNGRVTAIAAPDARALTFTYNTAGRISAVEGPSVNTGGASVKVEYGYDSNGNLTTVTDARGVVTTYTYDTAHRAVSITNPAVGTLTNEYDTAGRVVAQTTPLDGNATYVYAANANGTNTTRYTCPAGTVTDLTFRGGRIISAVIDPDGAAPTVTTYGYDIEGLPTTTTLPSGVTIEAEYDANGNKTSETAPAGPANTTGAVAGTTTTEWTYNDDNQPLTQTSSDGSAVEWEYDTRGNRTSEIVKLSAPTDSETAWTYGSSAHPGDVTKVTDARGNDTTFTYTSEGFVSSVTRPSGSVAAGADTTATTTFTHTPYGVVKTSVDPRGNATGASAGTYKTTNVFNSKGQLTQTTTPMGVNTYYGYDTSGRRITVKNDALKTWTTTYTVDGQVNTVTDPLGHVAVDNAYDNAGRLVESEDATGRTTGHTYDSHSRVLTTTDSAGTVTTFGYTPAGNVETVSVPDPNSSTPLVDTTVYDNAGRAWKTITPEGRTTTLRYDTGNRVDRVTDPAGNDVTNEFDAAGRVTAVTDRRGNDTTITYDAAGNVLSETDPLGNTASYAYDTAGRLSQSVDPRGHAPGATASDYATSFTYDLAGNRTVVTDQRGTTWASVFDADNRMMWGKNGRKRAAMYQYDTVGRLWKVVYYDTDGTTTYGYDNADRRTTVTTPKGGVWAYTHDDAGRVLSETDPAGAAQSYGYDTAGRLGTVTTPRGTATRAYDSLSRLTGVTYSDSTDPVSYSYTRDGLTAAMTDPNGTTAYDYSPVGLPTSIERTPTTGAAQEFTYDYNPNGDLTSRARPDGSSEAITRDAAGRPTAVTVTGVTGLGTTTQTFDPAGNPLVTTLPNGTTETRTYDRNGYVTNVKTKRDTTQLVSMVVNRDPNNQPNSISMYRGSTTEHRSFIYDKYERLSDVCYGSTTCTVDTAVQHFTYDLNGNRVTERNGTPTTGVTTAWAYDTTDRITAQQIGSAAATVPTYDADGNMTSDGTGRLWTIDLAGRTTSATTSGTTTAYEFDGANNRISETAGSAVTKYVWDENNALPMLAGSSADADGSGSAPPVVTSVRYSGDGSTPITQTVDGVNGWYAHDPLGSVTDLVNSAGVIVRTQDFTPYGLPRAAPGAPTPPTGTPEFAFGYTNSLADTDGTNYMRARQYSPTLGRFGTRDPLGQTGSAMWGGGYANLYNYVNGQTQSQIDPSGMCLWQKDVACWDLTKDVAGDLWQPTLGVVEGAAGLAATAAITVSPLGPIQYISTTRASVATIQRDGWYTGVNELFNPAYSVLDQGSVFWASVNNGCARKAGRAGLNTSIATAALVGVSVGGGTSGTGKVVLKSVTENPLEWIDNASVFIESTATEAIQAGTQGGLTSGAVRHWWQFGRVAADESVRRLNNFDEVRVQGWRNSENAWTDPPTAGDLP